MSSALDNILKKQLNILRKAKKYQKRRNVSSFDCIYITSSRSVVTILDDESGNRASVNKEYFLANAAESMLQ